MQKPWMCCHMLSALDDGISGSFMELETTEALCVDPIGVSGGCLDLRQCDDEGICRALCTKRSGKCL